MTYRTASLLFLVAGCLLAGSRRADAQATAISAGRAYNCAITAGGGLRCWGDNGQGQLGDGTIGDRRVAVDVVSLPSGVAGVAGGGAESGASHTCAISAGGGVQCWGNNALGQLGDGTRTSRLVPGAVSGLTTGMTAIDAGSFHACGLRTDGSVTCWGYNHAGQLGNGSTATHLSPVSVSGLSDATAIAVGGLHACAITAAGGVVCWGRNEFGQLGDGTVVDRHQPVAVSGLSSGVAAIAAGNAHTCAVTTGGAALCWGRNDLGRIGDGTAESRRTPTAVSGLSSGVTAIAAGDTHTCAAASGAVHCWGDNEFGQLGDGTNMRRFSPGAVSGAPANVTDLEAGADHTCALTASGEVWCWGIGTAVGDGSGLTRLTPARAIFPPSFTQHPRQAAAMPGATVTFSAEAAGTPAPTFRWQASTDGTAWSDVSNGAPYSGATTSTLTITPAASGLSGTRYRVVATNSGASAISRDATLTVASSVAAPVITAHPADVTISAGTSTTLSVTASGQGLNYQWYDGAAGTTTHPIAGATGHSFTTPTLARSRTVWVAVSNSAGTVNSSAATISMKPSDIRVFIDVPPAGASMVMRFFVTGWAADLGDVGTRFPGQGVEVLARRLTNGTPGPEFRVFTGTLDTTAYPRPDVAAAFGEQFLNSGYALPVELTPGTYRLIVRALSRYLQDDGTPLSRDATADITVATPPVSTISAASVAAGFSTTCAVAGGGAWCWGDNSIGQVGDGTTITRSAPVRVSGLSSGVAAVTIGGPTSLSFSEHACALTTAGAALCWGGNRWGNLGDGTTTARLTPTQVAGLSSGVTRLSAGYGFTCAVTTGGSALCWGGNHEGQLGDGTSDDRHTPVVVSGLATGVVDISAGYQHACALTSAGAVLCWGANPTGALGDGTRQKRVTPVAVAGLSSGVKAIAASFRHTCALADAGGVLCWGQNSSGELGDGTVTERLTPVAVSTLSSGIAAITSRCAITTEGALLCWGPNGLGQVGDGTTTTRLVPTPVKTLTEGVTSVSAGAAYTCATHGAGGTVWCWGTNSSSQLGSGYPLGSEDSPGLTKFPLSILTHPASRSVNEGQTASFTVEYIGTPDYSFRWQVSADNGGTWSDLSDGAPYSGVATPTLTVSAVSASLNGRRFRVIAGNRAATVTSDAAVLTVSQLLAITGHPVSQAVTAGVTVSFTAAATGDPTPTVKWQRSADGGSTWADILNAAPFSGTTTGTLTITGAPAALHASRFRLVATNTTGTATSNAATLTVRGNAIASPSALRFAATKNGATLTHVTAPQTVTVSFEGAGSQWSVVSALPWLRVTGSGTGVGTVTVEVANPDDVIGNSSSLSAVFLLVTPNAPSTTVQVPVILTVSPATAPTTAPFGQLETPAQNASGIVGAIGVTGWAMDDVGVAHVRIFRNCLPFENQASCQTVGGHSVVFVGNAAFLSGARPDVEAAFPNNPQAYRAGWGYLMMTSMLPHVTAQQAYGGVGPLTLYAFATDVEGNVTLLGRSQADHTPTSITMANDTIAKPFGAIDTPGQGETVSGIVNNFGWALTPDSDTTAGNSDILIPTTGSTMFVFIDGQPVAPIAYNQCRGTVGNPPAATVFCNDDVANIFGNLAPQAALSARSGNPTRYRNLDAGRAAIGAYQIDTTKLANGLHTIAWSVTDSAGRTEGIGSRFFTVLNSASDLEVAAREIQARTPVVHGRLGPEPTGGPLAARAPAGDGRLAYRTGFDLAAPFAPLPAAEDGVHRVPLTALDRLELRVPGADRAHLLVNGELRDLPAGASFRNGILAWIPPAGYVGLYDLDFGGGRRVRVAIAAR